jgi:mRNA-degrading endonuclease RelE of RelBE toxin-antitoxin system
MTPKPHPFHIHIPDKLWKEFQKLAEKNRRKLKEEALIAIENHVKTKTQ